MAKFTDEDYFAIRDWVLDGCICVRSQLTYRFQPTYPNTFCLFWVRPQIPRFIGFGPGCAAWACLDIHYRRGDGGALQALGGFWVNGVNDRDLKPEQEFRDAGPASRDAYRELRGKVPAVAPRSEEQVTYRTFMSSLRAHDASMQGIGAEIAKRVVDKYFA